MERPKQTLSESQVKRRTLLRAGVFGAATLFFGKSIDALAQTPTPNTPATPTQPGLFTGSFPFEQAQATPTPQPAKAKETPVPAFKPDAVVSETWFDGCVVVPGRKWSGIATNYGPGADCYRCPSGNKTAMGVEFDPNEPLIAFNELALGTDVLVTNEDNGRSMHAYVGDTGGFDKPPYYYVADLGPKVKSVLQAGGKTQVTIQELTRCDNPLSPKH